VSDSGAYSATGRLQFLGFIVKKLMIFQKKDRLVGLDIGSSLIKAAALKHTSKGYELRKFGIAQVEPGAIIEGRIINQQSLSNTISLLFKSLKIYEKNVAISVVGHSMLIRTINIPSVPESKTLEKVIYSEARQYLPYDMDEVHIDYQVLGKKKPESSELNILLVAAHKEMIAEYSELIRLAGLKLQIIDVDIFALQNAYNLLLNNHTDSFTLLADIGASRTSLNICRGDRSFMIRDIMYGTDRLVKNISNEFGITYEEAMQALIRQNNDEDTHDQDRLRDILLNNTQSWCAEIIDMVNEFQSGAPDNRVINIVLSGGGTLIGEFEEHLLSVIPDADISIIDPFKALMIREKKFSKTFLNKAAPWAAIAIGLALRRVNDKC
jgi:type IV pilus assembly protein PilM